MSDRTLSQSRHSAPYFLLFSVFSAGFLLALSTESTELGWNGCILELPYSRKQKKRPCLYAALLTQWCILFLTLFANWYVTTINANRKAGLCCMYMSTARKTENSSCPFYIFHFYAFYCASWTTTLWGFGAWDLLRSGDYTWDTRWGRVPLHFGTPEVL